VAIIAKLGHPNQNSYISVAQANAYFDNRRDVTEWDNLNSVEREEVLLQAAHDCDAYNFVGRKWYESQGMEFPRRVRSYGYKNLTHRTVIGACATPITINSFRHPSFYSPVYGKYPTSYWKYGAVHITNGTGIRSVANIASSNVTNGSITLEENLSATPTTNTSFIVFAPIDQNIARAQAEQALYLLKNIGIETYSNLKEIGVKRVEIGRARIDFNDGAVGRISLAPESKKLLSRWIRSYTRIGRA